MKNKFYNTAKSFFNRSPEITKYLPREIKFQVLLGKNFFTQKLQKTRRKLLRQPCPFYWPKKIGSFMINKRHRHKTKHFYLNGFVSSKTSIRHNEFQFQNAAENFCARSPKNQNFLVKWYWWTRKKVASITLPTLLGQKLEVSCALGRQKSFTSRIL